MTRDRKPDRVRTRLDRRAFLKTSAVTGVVLGGGAAVSGTAAAATTVSGGGAALQNAIDAASAGETLVVTDSATYDPVVVDVGVTVETTADPTIVGTGGTGAAVSLDADSVTFEGFTVTNPEGLLGIKVERDRDEVTITDNTVADVGPTGRLGVTGIVVGQGDHDDIDISNNTIRNLDQETTDDSGFPTVNGILFDADNSDPGTLSNSGVNNNLIQSIESDIAPLGLVVQHDTDGVSINNNEIRDLVADDATDSDQSDGVDFGFTFAQGINIASESTVDTEVNHNVVEDITSAETILPEAVKIDGDGSGVTFRANQFLVAVGLNNQNGASDAAVVDAKNNYWGSREGPEEAPENAAADDDDRADVVGNVTYEPFLQNPPGRGRGN
jgi:hypothetical protein